jgi:uncharacterized MnhB-related membrane protein
MLQALLTAGAVICAVLAIYSKRLLLSALWLAGASALVALILYVLGAREVAVIELSVGAGLVTVLFVFAISIAGEEAMDARAVLPRPLAWALVIVSSILLGWMILPSTHIDGPIAETSFAMMLWQDRGLDVLAQIALIFAGVLGVLGLLAEARAPIAKRAAEKSVTQPAPAAPAQPARREVRA